MTWLSSRRCSDACQRTVGTHDGSFARDCRNAACGVCGMTDNKPSRFDGDITIARERFLWASEAVVNLARHMSAVDVNHLAYTMCLVLSVRADHSEFLERWEEERECEKRGSATPAHDADWNAFLRAIGATEYQPGRPSKRRSPKRIRESL